MKLRTIISIILTVLITSIINVAVYTVSAADADFEIGDLKFKTEVEDYNIAFYRINSDGSLSDAGKMELDDAAEDFHNNEIKYEVYGEEVAVIVVMGDKQMAFVQHYDSTTGKFRYPREDEEVKYDNYRTKFSLKGVDFYAEIEQDYFDEANDFPIYLTISVIGGYDKNLKDIIVNKPGPVGTTAGKAYVHEVRNYFEVSGDELIITSEIGENMSYTFDRNTNKFVEYGGLSGGSEGDEISSEILDVHDRDTISITGTVKYVTAGGVADVTHPPVIVLDNPLTVRYHTNLDGLIVSDGQIETLKEIQFSCDEYYDEGQRLSVTGDVMIAHTSYHATNIVLIDSIAEVLENENVNITAETESADNIYSDTVNTDNSVSETTYSETEISTEKPESEIGTNTSADDYAFDINETPDVSYEKKDPAINAVKIGFSIFLVVSSVSLIVGVVVYLKKNKG